IQSAMGGEHGRGFTQVADEIRALAERVTEATKQITGLVKGIQGDTYDAVVAKEESTKEVVRGSTLADKAGNALQSIYGSIERQAGAHRRAGWPAAATRGAVRHARAVGVRHERRRLARSGGRPTRASTWSGGRADQRRCSIWRVRRQPARRLHLRRVWRSV